VPIDPNAPPEDNDDNRNGGGSGQPSLQPEQLPSASNILTRPARVLRRYR